MLPIVLGWIVMAAGLFVIATRMPSRNAALAWAVFAAVACALGSFAIARQPLGEPTVAGRLGSAVVRWGFRAGQGQLPAAAFISWIVWLLIGGTAIAALGYRADVRHLLLISAWAISAGALLYVIGVMLSNRGAGPAFYSSLLGLCAALVGMIGVSAALWFLVGTPPARKFALIVAGGPLLFVAVGYGLFLLVVLTVGRNARWN